MNNSNHTDKALFLQVSEGNEHAFLELFHLYVPRIRPLILQIIKNESVVPDLVQDIFLRIWIAREKLPEVTSPQPWIFSIVYHQCFNYLRHQAVKHKSEQISAERWNNAAFDPSPETDMLFNETKDFLHQAIAELPLQARKVYRLSREEGLKIDEIAAQLNISPKTVKNTLTRASQAIRQSLISKGVYLPALLFASRFL